MLVALAGDYGKPRPALVVQSNHLADLPSVVLCPITSTVRQELKELRITIEPSLENGLRETSQVMIDKPMTAPRTKLRATIGTLGEREMTRVNASLSIVLGIV